MTTTNLRSLPPRGMRDLLPDEVALRDWAASVILQTYRSYGFTRIETPAIESIELLKRGEGGENLQLIYEILKRGEKLEKALEQSAEQARGADSVSSYIQSSTFKQNRNELSDLGLRFDLTVPLVRFYSNNQANLPNPFKPIQIGSVWRAESPQAGRFRQFTQCDIDIIGVKGNFAELELLKATADALLNLTFEDFIIRINDRRLLQDLALHCGFERSRLDSVFIAVDKLDKIGIDGIVKELKETGHPEPAIEKLKAIFEPIKPLLDNTALGGVEQFQQIVNHLPSFENAESLSELKELVAAVSAQTRAKYSIVFDPTLVRGMGYYTGPIFEIVVRGHNHSIAGGGRYDRMIEKFIDREVPACGFSIGFERIIAIMLEEGRKPAAIPNKLAFIYDPKRDQLADVAVSLNKLRADFEEVSLVPRKKELKKQLDQLVTQGFSHFCAFAGDPENLNVKELSPGG